MRSPNTSAYPGAQASIRARFKIRQSWIDQAQARHGLSTCERLIAGRLALHQNLHTGRCNPGIRTLAREAGISERSAFRAIVGLEQKGLIEVLRDPSRGGRNHPNGYRLLPTNADRVTAFEGLMPEPETLTAETGNADTVTAELKELSSGGGASASSFGGEREAHASRADSPPFGAAAPDGAAPEEDQEQRSSLFLTKTSLPSEPIGPKEGATDQRGAGPRAQAKTSALSEPVTPEEKGFAELQRIWSVRPWSNGPKEIAAAETAYAVAAAEVGVDPILTGARAWVAACDAPRYLPALTKWLSARSWEVPPPLRRAPSAPRQQRGYRKPKPDIARMMLALGEEG